MFKDAIFHLQVHVPTVFLQYSQRLKSIIIQWIFSHICDGPLSYLRCQFALNKGPPKPPTHLGPPSQWVVGRRTSRPKFVICNFIYLYNPYGVRETRIKRSWGTIVSLMVDIYMIIPRISDYIHFKKSVRISLCWLVLYYCSWHHNRWQPSDHSWS